MIRILLYFIIFIIFINGCSEKKYFTPESISGDVDIDLKLDDDIVQSNRNGAKLSNGTIVTSDGIFKLNLKDNYIFLNMNENLLIVANYDDNSLSLLDINGTEFKKFEFEYMPLSASLKDGILAVILSNNNMLLWDINTNEQLFSSKGSVVYAIDSKIASPLFSNGDVIFPSFDGRLVIVKLANFKITDTIALGSGDFFSNIIYLSVYNSAIIAATKHKLVTIINGKDFIKNFDIIDVLNVNDKIYIITLEGEVIELDLLLNELNKKKFPFATLSGIVVDDAIYTLESQGYLIKINKNDFADFVYKIDISKYKDYFFSDNIIYYNNKIIKFPK